MMLEPTSPFAVSVFNVIGLALGLAVFLAVAYLALMTWRVSVGPRRRPIEPIEPPLFLASPPESPPEPRGRKIVL